jgi:hypothetical protein
LSAESVVTNVGQNQTCLEFAERLEFRANQNDSQRVDARLFGTRCMSVVKKIEIDRRTIRVRTIPNALSDNVTPVGRWRPSV